MRGNFRLVAYKTWETECPACKAKAFRAGVKYNEEPSDEESDEDFEELVDVLYVAEEFCCPSCNYISTVVKPLLPRAWMWII